MAYSSTSIVFSPTFEKRGNKSPQNLTVTAVQLFFNIIKLTNLVKILSIHNKMIISE
jgi:hypothetical protein